MVWYILIAVWAVGAALRQGLGELDLYGWIVLLALCALWPVTLTVEWLIHKGLGY